MLSAFQPLRSGLWQHHAGTPASTFCVLLVGCRNDLLVLYVKPKSRLSNTLGDLRGMRFRFTKLPEHLLVNFNQNHPLQAMHRELNTFIPDHNAIEIGDHAALNHVFRFKAPMLRYFEDGRFIARNYILSTWARTDYRVSGN